MITSSDNLSWGKKRPTPCPERKYQSIRFDRAIRLERQAIGYDPERADPEGGNTVAMIDKFKAVLADKIKSTD